MDKGILLQRAWTGKDGGDDKRCGGAVYGSKALGRRRKRRKEFYLVERGTGAPWTRKEHGGKIMGGKERARLLTRLF